MTSPQRRLALGTAALASFVFTAPARAQIAPSDDFQPVESSADEPPTEVEPPTREPPFPRFGEVGEVVVSGTAIGNVTKTTYDGSDASRFNIDVAPGVDLFVARGVSLGLAINLSYHDDKGYGADGSFVETKTSTYAAGPRIGFAVPIGERVSFWPQFKLQIAHSQAEAALISGPSLSIGTASGASSTSHVGPTIGAYLPILVHLAPRLFLGFGPSFFHDFSHAIDVDAPSSASAQQTTIGVALTVGGYAGGPSVADKDQAPDDADHPHRSPRFGRRGGFVLTNDLSLGASSTTYSETSASSLTYGIALGADLFVTDHVSLGVAVSDAYVDGKFPSPGAGGDIVESKTTTLGIGPRLGVEIPLDERISFWPRIGLTYGVSDVSSQLGAFKNEYTLTTLTLVANAPLLVHLAPHWFVGIGPTISYDLSGQLDGGRTLQATRYGVGGILGGWL